MDAYLLVDFGSTYTKLTLVGKDAEEVLITSSSYTTIETNVLDGFRKAFSKIEGYINENNINIIKRLACSSAAGGLKMISVGITPRYTVEATKRAALGAGARLLKSYSYFLSEGDVADISNSNADIILISGGAENGNTKYLLDNSKMLLKLKKNIPIIVSGNTATYLKLREIFKDIENEVYFVSNLMPDVNRIEPEEVRSKIREVFMKKIVSAKGMEDVESRIDEILMPTPTAVLYAAKLISDGINGNLGMGSTVIIDIGGATTDVHSVSEPIDENYNYYYDDLPEPYVKRTVEGDLGMRYSAISAYEADGKEFFEKKGLNDDEALHACEFRSTNTSYLPTEYKDAKFDNLLAEHCASVALKRHSGHTRESYVNGGFVTVQNGKNLKGIKNIIGTGGVLINSDVRYEILHNATLTEDENTLLPTNPDYYFDQKYILSAMGLLSTVNPELSLKILKKSLIKL